MKMEFQFPIRMLKKNKTILIRKVNVKPFATNDILISFETKTRQLNVNKTTTL